MRIFPGSTARNVAGFTPIEIFLPPRGSASNERHKAPADQIAGEESSRHISSNLVSSSSLSFCPNDPWPHRLSNRARRSSRSKTSPGGTLRYDLSRPKMLEALLHFACRFTFSETKGHPFTLVPLPFTLDPCPPAYPVHNPQPLHGVGRVVDPSSVTPGQILINVASAQRRPAADHRYCQFA